MKCAHPYCNRGIGLMSYRRPLSKARYCSKRCRDTYVAEAVKPAGRRAAASYFEWLFLQPPMIPLQQVARTAHRVRPR